MTPRHITELAEQHRQWLIDATPGPKSAERLPPYLQPPKALSIWEKLKKDYPINHRLFFSME